MLAKIYNIRVLITFSIMAIVVLIAFGIIFGATQNIVAALAFSLYGAIVTLPLLFFRPKRLYLT